MHLIKPMALLGSLLITYALSAFEQTPPLPVDQAFAISTPSIEGRHISLKWDIAPDYYMYRSKIKVISDDGVTFGELQFPPGKVKSDPAFGEVEVYYNQLQVQSTYKSASGKEVSGDFNVTITYQGCAEKLGLCYPPEERNFKLTAETANTDNVANKINSKQATDNKRISPAVEKKSTNAFERFFSSSAKQTNNAPLNVDEAFAFALVSTDEKTVVARWQIAKGHYLYKHKTQITGNDADSETLIDSIAMPSGKAAHDEYFGDIEKYEGELNIPIRLKQEASSIALTIKYQGCSEITGICYPPQTVNETINLSALPATSSSNTATAVSTSATVASSNASPNESEQDKIIRFMRNAQLYEIVLWFLGGGILLAFTPCVFPMIPILLGIITGQGTISRGQSALLATAYVLPMAIVFAAIGMIAALAGQNLAAAFQNQYVLYAFAGVFVLLALSMFGWYNLQMPQSIQAKLTHYSNSLAGGSFINAVVMGILSALIIGPCVTPPLLAAVLFTAETQDVVVGGSSLFALGLGMGLPLIVLATFAGQILPRAGAWMEHIKYFFGFLLLAMGIWMLSRVINDHVITLLSAMLLAVMAIYSRAFDAVENNTARVFKGLGLLLMFYALTLVASVLADKPSLTKPLNFISGGSNTEQHLSFKRIKSLDDLNAEIAAASQQNKNVMFDFYADWCITCKEMEAGAFADSRVIAALKNTIVLQADLTANDDTDKALLKHFKLIGPPAILFFNKSGQHINNATVVGAMSADEFYTHIQRVLR